MNFCKAWVTISVMALVTLAPCRTAFAQIDTVIVGRAVDGSGGVLPGVMGVGDSGRHRRRRDINDERRLGYIVAYTWSKALGDFLDHLSVGGSAVGNAPLTAYNMDLDCGPIAFDIPRRLVTSFIYELPVGPGRDCRSCRRPRRHRRRLVGDRYPHPQRRAVVHDYGQTTRPEPDRSNQRANCIGHPLPETIVTISAG